MKELFAHLSRKLLRSKSSFKLLRLLLLFALTSLTACGGSEATVEPTVTVEPTMTLMPTSTATATPTSTPTLTPTPKLPVSPGTAIPTSDSVISADNLDNVVELARWGSGVITDAVYSPDGGHIAIASTVGISIYQADTMDEDIYFETGASVNSVVFSSDGENLVTGLDDNTVKIWQVSDGSMIKSFEGHKEETTKKDESEPEITSVAISPEGSFLAAGSTDGSVSLWQVSDGSLIDTITSHSLEVSRVLFSPDGQILFSASLDGTVRMTNIADLSLVRALSGVYIYDMALSLDGTTLAAKNGSFPGKIVLWEVESGKQLQTINLDESDSDVSSIALSPDGKYIGAAREDYSVKIWDASSGEGIITFEDLQPDGTYYLSQFAVAFSPDSQFILAAGADVIGIWNVTNGTLLNNKETQSQPVYYIALSPDQKALASVEGTVVFVREISDAEPIPFQDEVYSSGNVAFSPDGTTIAVGLFDGSARLWPITEQGARRSFEISDNWWVSAIAFSPDGNTLALGAYDKIEVRQTEDGSLINTISPGTTRYINKLAFSPGGEYLASANYADVIKLFDASTGRAVKTYTGNTLAFSPDGKLLAGGSFDKEVQVLDIESGETLLSLQDLPDEVHSVAFSPDAKLLLAGCADGTIHVWNALDGTLIKNWKVHSYGVEDLIFTSDGTMLISASLDGTIRFWGLKP